MRSQTAARRILLAGLTAVLLAAIGTVTVEVRRVSAGGLVGGVRSLYPVEDIGSWIVEWRPVAETEEMQRAQRELLNFDDASFAFYTMAGARIAIYAAYWRSGKMSHRLVASHTPDVCWVGAGWTPRLTGRSTIDARLAVEGWVAAEQRIFERAGQVEHVVFCHYVGREPNSYETSRQPPWYAMFKDVYRMTLRQRQEQLFWRISSNRPLDEFRNAAPVQQFLERVNANYVRGQLGR